MTTLAHYTRAPWVRYRLFDQDLRVPIHLPVVCLWSAIGLTLTGSLFALGFAAEIGQAIAVAG